MGLLDYLRSGNDAQGRAADGYFNGRLEVLEKTPDTLDLPDYTPDVKELDENPDKVWQNSEAKNFKKDGKINFLHLSDAGKFTLTIIKPGSKTVLEAEIPVELVAQVRENIKGMKDWDKSSSAETWDRADGDKDGNTYMFTRGLILSKDETTERKLQWDGRHKNRGNIVEVRDTFRFLEVPPYNFTKKVIY